LLVDGDVVIDNAVTGRKVRLEAVALRVVKAMWRAERAEEAVGALAAEVGEESIVRALGVLVDRGLSFPDLASCDRARPDPLAW
jgi:hypothetical protein